MQLVWAERSYPITGGVLASVLFHVLLALLIVFGVPSFLKPEVLEAPPTIELATLADITAAPKVDKAGKPMEKPKTKTTPPHPHKKQNNTQTPRAPKPKKKTTPGPPNPAPPPPATPPPGAEQEAAVVPDKPLEKLPDEK